LSGQQQHAGGVLVQPSHWSQIFPAQFRRHQFQHAFLSCLIGGADIALGLVQQHIEILVAADLPSVQADRVGFRLYCLIGFPDNRTVYGDFAFLYHLPQFPTGIHGTGREKLIQSHRGTSVLFFIWLHKLYKQHFLKGGFYIWENAVYSLWESQGYCSGAGFCGSGCTSRKQNRHRKEIVRSDGAQRLAFLEANGQPERCCVATETVQLACRCR